MCEIAKLGAVIANTPGIAIAISALSDVRLINQVVVKAQPAGVIVSVGRTIVFEVSERRLKLVTPTDHVSSTTTGVRVPHVSKKVTLKVWASNF